MRTRRGQQMAREPPLENVQTRDTRVNPFTEWQTSSILLTLCPFSCLFTKSQRGCYKLNVLETLNFVEIALLKALTSFKHRVLQEHISVGLDRHDALCSLNQSSVSAPTLFPHPSSPRRESCENPILTDV